MRRSQHAGFAATVREGVLQPHYNTASWLLSGATRRFPTSQRNACRRAETRQKSCRTAVTNPNSEGYIHPCDRKGLVSLMLNGSHNIGFRNTHGPLWAALVTPTW